MNKNSLLIILSITILLILNTYSYLFHNKFYPSLYEVKNTPQQYQNMLIEYKGGDLIAISPSEKKFTYQEGEETIDVNYNDNHSPRKSIFGKTSIFGSVRNDEIDLIDMHNHDYNYFKYLISVFGFVILFYYLFKEWKFSNWRLSPKSEDKNA